LNYLWALDLSLSNTGIAIFTNDGKCVETLSIETKPEKSTQERLGIIGDKVLKLAKKYDPFKIVIEQGFTRFNTSTQQLYRVHGLINYLFRDYEQIYYPATKVKLLVGGKGNLKKEQLRDIIYKKYDTIQFHNLDESDAFAIGMTYFLENKILGAIL
jgi:Holliday junction resolvasome RuvABC endonuclease subunit